MAFIHVGPTRFYTAVNSGIAVASDGDTVLIDPGTYVETVIVDKAINLRANTTTYTNDVIIDSTAINTSAVNINYAPGTQKSVYIEGLRIRRHNGSWTATFVINDCNSNLSVYINKCYIIGIDSAHYPFHGTDDTLALLEVKNTYIDGGYCEYKSFDWTAIGSSSLLKNQYDDAARLFYQCTGSPDEHDYVTTSTSGYGPYYGDFYVGIEVGYFDGYVYQEGTPVARDVRLYKREDGELINETTSSGDGYYYLTTTYEGAHYMICLDDDAGYSYNDLIISNIYPTTFSG